MYVEYGRRNVMVSVLVMMISGCSFALSTPDPLRAAHVAPRCDTSKSLVALDWVIAAVGATAALTALGEQESEAAAVFALGSVAFIASAVRGNRVVNSCRESFAEYASTQGAPLEVAEKPQTFEDPYAEPADRPARRVVASPPVAARAPAPTAPTAPTAPVAPPTAKPASTPAPAPAADEDWAAFWTEIP